ncbi:MAG: tetratricopeptide repeat protein, partial [Muribaculaceae bacterium]|nr:tetratricopeptide repeat protein [Muribaculaceae bacterium]
AAAIEYALQHLPLETMVGVDSVLRNGLLRSGGRMVDKSPGDFYSAYNYSMLCQHLGRPEEAMRVLERFRNINPGHAGAMEVLNDLYIDEREFDKALDILNQYERIKGQDIKLILRKSAVHIAKGDSVGALNEANAYLSAHRSDPQSWVLKGQIEQYLQRNDSAIASYTRAEDLSEPGYGGPAKIQLAQLYRQMGDSVSYDRKTYEALMAEDLNIEIKKDLLQYYISAQLMDSVDNGRSERLMEVLVSQYPHEPEILSLSSDYSAFRKNYNKALEEIRYCTDLEPTNMDYRRKALVLAYMAENDTALDSVYNDAVRFMHPLPVDYTIEYCRILSATGRESEAVEKLRKLLSDEYNGLQLTETLDTSALNKNLSVEGLENLIDIYQVSADAFSQMKRYPRETEVCYENVLKLNPDDPLVLNNYAYYLVRDDLSPSEESLSKAMDMSERAVAGDPGNATYMDTRAWVLYRAGEYESARSLQEQAIERSRGDRGEDEADGEEMTEYYDHYGDILQALGETDEAIKYWRKALDINPDNTDIKSKLKGK